MHRKAARLSTQSLAWERLPAARPQSAGCLRWRKARPIHHRTELVRRGDAARMRQFRADHAGELKAVVLDKRARADAAVLLARTALPPRRRAGSSGSKRTRTRSENCCGARPTTGSFALEGWRGRHTCYHPCRDRRRDPGNPKPTLLVEHSVRYPANSSSVYI
jgi:hypothetical protein